MPNLSFSEADQGRPAPMKRGTHIRGWAVCLLLAGLAWLAAEYRFDLPPYSLQFRREEVRAYLVDGSPMFWGRYQLLSRHRFPRTYRIGFPLWPRGQSCAVAGLGVRQDGHPIPFSWKDDGLALDLTTRPGQETVLEVAYSLMTGRPQAVYVTRTANAWPEPPQEAGFFLAPPLSSNYHPPGATSTVFPAFSPESDWIVSW